MSRKKNADLDFNETEKEILIDFVRNNPPLYSQQHAKYRDSELKNRLWQEIGRKLNKSGKYTHYTVYSKNILMVKNH